MDGASILGEDNRSSFWAAQGNIFVGRKTSCAENRRALRLPSGCQDARLISNIRQPTLCPFSTTASVASTSIVANNIVLRYTFSLRLISLSPGGLAFFDRSVLHCARLSASFSCIKHAS